MKGQIALSKLKWKMTKFFSFIQLYFEQFILHIWYDETSNKKKLIITIFKYTTTYEIIITHHLEIWSLSIYHFITLPKATFLIAYNTIVFTQAFLSLLFQTKYICTYYPLRLRQSVLYKCQFVNVAPGTYKVISKTQ